MTLGDWKANFSFSLLAEREDKTSSFAFLYLFSYFRTCGIILFITSSDNFESSLCVLRYPACMYWSETYYQNVHCSRLSFLIKCLYRNKKHIWWLKAWFNRIFSISLICAEELHILIHILLLLKHLALQQKVKFMNPSLNLQSNQTEATNPEQHKIWWNKIATLSKDAKPHTA